MSDLAKRLENERWKMTKWETVNGRPVELNSAELTAILAALEDAERIQRGIVIGFRKEDDPHEGRAWWNGGTWLEKGEEVIVIEARRAGR